MIWVHLENAESKYGYNYGDKQKIFDMTWYQKYKASVDGLLSGFLWLGYLWLLFKRAPAILLAVCSFLLTIPRSADMPMFLVLLALAPVMARPCSEETALQCVIRGVGLNDSDRCYYSYLESGAADSKPVCRKSASTMLAFLPHPFINGFVLPFISFR